MGSWSGVYVAKLLFYFQPSTQPQDIYSVVDISVKKLPSEQPIGSSTQPQDIYSVVDKSTKFRKGKLADQLSLPPAEESRNSTQTSDQEETS